MVDPQRPVHERGRLRKDEAAYDGRAPDDAARRSISTGSPSRFGKAPPDWYLVKSGSTVDDSGGGFYFFTTSQVLVDYTIRIKPTNKASSGKSAHFYIDVANNEALPYTGLELRFYFKADAATAAGMVAKGFDNQTFDVGGIAGPLDIAYGAPKAVPGMDGVWYLPITLNSTLPVAWPRPDPNCRSIPGGGGWGDYAFANLKDAWSIRSHARPGDPVDFPGVDSQGGNRGLQGPRDGGEGQRREHHLLRGRSLHHRILQGRARLRIRSGRAGRPAQDPIRGQARLDGPGAKPSRANRFPPPGGWRKPFFRARLPSPPAAASTPSWSTSPFPASDSTRNADGTVAFKHALKLAEGTNVFDVIAWDTAHCAVDARHLVMNWRKGPPEPPPQVQTPVADPKGKSAKDSIVVALATATKDASIWYTLDGKDPSPGAAGTLPYSGPIVIKASATLKAIATKPEWKPSGILSETYGISKYAVVNPVEGRLLDADADGRADAVSIPLDCAGAALDAPTASAQAAGARWSGGWIASGYRFAGRYPGLLPCPQFPAHPGPAR